MEKVDLLDELLSANPHAPATNGVVLLLRAETKHGFKAHEQRFDKIDRSLELLAQQVVKHDVRFDRVEANFISIGQRFDGIDRRLDGMDQRFDGIDRRLDGMDQQLGQVNDQLQTLVQQVGVLVARG